MSASQPFAMDPAVLARLACPICRGNLRQEGESLICAACRRAYPVMDGIAVLIAPRAEKLPR